MDKIEEQERTLYLPNEPPNESCDYYNKKECSKFSVCPKYCRRYNFISDFNKGIENEQRRSNKYH